MWHLIVLVAGGAIPLFNTRGQFWVGETTLAGPTISTATCDNPG